ncbi:MAG: ArnT family glycosyltransferase, partial [Gemmata sp.]
MGPSLNPIAVGLPAGTGAGVGKLTDRACKRLAGLLVLASVLFHLGYLIFDCPIDLAPDEAHYWQWSRHLAWSYYSKGPLVAWLVRASCEVFGPASDALVGSPALAVRLPAVACHALLLGGWYALAVSTLKSHRAALGLVALALTLPPVIAGAVLMTIDPPFLACWSWAAVGVWRALSARQAALRWWALAAVCSALGVMAKYPMVLLPCAVFGYLLFTRRDALKRPGFWVFASGSALGLAPVLVWNATNDWVTFRHVGTQAVGASGSGVRWLGPLTFAAGQAAFLIGVWFVVWAAAAWHARRAADPAIAYLWWTSVPVWLVFAAAGFKASGQLNWPAAAYVSGFVLCVHWVRERLGGPNARYVARLVSAGLAVGLALSTLV